MIPLFTIETDICGSGCELRAGLLLYVFLILMALFIGVILWWRRSRNRLKEVVPPDTEPQELAPLEDEPQVLVPLDNGPQELVPHFPLYPMILPIVQFHLEVTFDLLWPVEPIDDAVLIFFIYASYSSLVRIGRAGSHCSDGHRLARRYLSRCLRRGSTETVSQSLLIYTDNTKVEQLSNRPRTRDQRHYPELFQILHRHRNSIQNTSIDVERVRGHPTCESGFI